MLTDQLKERKMSAWNGDLQRVPIGASWPGCGLWFFQIDWPHSEARDPQLSHLSVSHRGEPELPHFRTSSRRGMGSGHSHEGKRELGLEMPDLAKGNLSEALRELTWFRRVSRDKVQGSGWEQTHSYQVPVGPM